MSYEKQTWVPTFKKHKDMLIVVGLSLLVGIILGSAI